MKGGADASHRSVLSISPSAIVISPHQISIPSQQVRFHNICVTTNQENVETTANHTFFTSSFKISQCAYVRRRPCTEIGRPIQPRPVQAKEKTHYASVDRRNPYFWTKVSISAGPREPYGYCTGFGRGPLRPSIQCRIGVKICHTLESARHSYI